MAPMPMIVPLAAALPSTRVSKSKPSPSRPLLRRATLGGSIRSREEAGLDADVDGLIASAPTSPSKRARTVTFNLTIEEQVFSPTTSMAGSAPSNSLDLDAIRLEVKIAIEEHVKGLNEEGYDMLKELFAPAKRRDGDGEKGASNEKLKAHLMALTSFVSLLGKNCSGLVKALLECEWFGRDDEFIRIYVQFLGNLGSAQGAYVGVVLNALVGSFNSIRPSSGRLPDCAVVECEQMMLRVHIALKYLLRLIPSASGTLSPILSGRFPFMQDTKKAHMIYIENLIRIVEYAPELKSEIFALITERLIKIDVQMLVDLDDIDDEIAAAIVQTLSLQSTTNADEEDEDDEDGDESDADSVTSEESDNESNRLKAVKSNVEKMDAILDTLFLVYTPYFSDPHSVTAHRMFDTLLAHFRNIILPTYRSRHTQFLLFHFAQKSEHLVDTFAGECVDIAFKPGRPAVLKQSAAAYLASFVARGAHVLPHVVRDVFDYIGTCIDTIREENEQTCRGPDLQRYGTFYATTQALLYIFCFRWRDLVVSSSSDDAFEDDDPAAFLGQELQWRQGVRELLSRTIYSKLNPLKICAPSIVEEFARIATQLNFMMVYPLMEANKRVRLSQYALGAGSSNSILREAAFRYGKKGETEDESWHQLDAYFPFDPYQLPVSRRWIEGDYVVWKGLPGAMDESDEDDTTDIEESSVGLVDEDVDTATEEDDGDE